MRVLTAAIALAAAACGGAPTGTGRSLPPPTLQVSGSTRIRTDSGGQSELEVLAALSNPTSVHILVGMGAQCPLYVHVYPDPTGAYMVPAGGPAGCAASAMTLDLAPGDSAVLTRVVPPDSLASLAPGTYGVALGVVTSTAIIGMWAGTVQLPVGSGP
ncbi:MAG: hypothetical protein KGL38_10175 [Gemmatimonadota bacterium]|nr:hypothetical protein [Gemmatimonadota bacterium]MDE3173283.1 hypothetical protein [Gemmatimonadota bacterium]